MTDKPKTLALDTAEWGTLVASNLQRALNYVGSINDLGRPNANDVQGLVGHLERMKSIVVAWGAAEAARSAQAAPAPAHTPAKAAHPVANGSAVANKKRGGWPKGKPRAKAVQAGADQ